MGKKWKETKRKQRNFEIAIKSEVMLNVDYDKQKIKNQIKCGFLIRSDASVWSLK